MYKLKNEYIEKNYYEFLCSYGKVDNSKIISYKNYIPETFYVHQKRVGEKLVFFENIDFKSWVYGMTKDICSGIEEVDIITLCDATYENLTVLLDFIEGKEVIANQEFVDIIRKVVVFTLTGDVNKNINFSHKFNDLASRLMPIVINEVSKNHYSLKELLIISIISGLSGLDLKGAPAAASSYSNEGIPMAEFFNLNLIDAAHKYINLILDKFNNCNLGKFDFKIFENILVRKKILVWMTDDYIESYFDLLIIEKILAEYPINVILIPKNGYYGNDFSYDDLNNILETNLFPSLKKYLTTGKFKICSKGPKMGAANINKLSQECIDIIKQSDTLVMKGCRIHEMLQGGLNKETFSSFIVVRKLSEITSGFDSSSEDVIFVHLEPGEYAFWGTNYLDVYRTTNGMTDKNIHCVSTIRDHFARKDLSSVIDIVKEFNRLSLLSKNYSGNKIPIFKELDLLAQKLKIYTANQYTNKSIEYSLINRPEMDKIEKNIWLALSNQIKLKLNKQMCNITMLDIGTGDGKAIEFITKLGGKCIGVDNSIGFIDILKTKTQKRIIPENSYVFADMCDLSAIHEKFDVVRMNASLLHLPVIEKNYTADLALHESYKVLNNGGLIIVVVKHGDGLNVIDTVEGLGKRVYQFYTHKTLNEILYRNGFETIEEMDLQENRSSGKIHWIIHIAQKNSL